MRTRFLENMNLLKLYLDTRRGVGHTRTMVEGVIHSGVDVIVLAHDHQYADRLKHEIQPRILPHRVTTVTLQNIEFIMNRSDPLVIDNAALSSMIGLFFDELHRQDIEINALRSEVRSLKDLKLGGKNGNK